jgi:hypothetical protein
MLQLAEDSGSGLCRYTAHFSMTTNSNDDYPRPPRTSREVVERWIVNYSPEGSLERTLVDVSDALDRLAAKVNGVVLSPAPADSAGSNSCSSLQ